MNKHKCNGVFYYNINSYLSVIPLTNFFNKLTKTIYLASAFEKIKNKVFGIVNFLHLAFSVKLQGWAEKFIWCHVCCRWLFGQWDPNTGRSVWAVRRTVLKNKTHLVTFRESILVNLWTSQPTLVLVNWMIQIKIYSSKFKWKISKINAEKGFKIYIFFHLWVHAGQ